MLALLLFFILLFSHSLQYQSYDYENCLVNTPGLGIMQGKCNEKINKFLGIRFAMPPIGNLRWKPPQRMSYSKGTFERPHLANKWGDYCWQQDTPSNRTNVVASSISGLLKNGVLYKHSLGSVESEDCLFLNVFTPKTKQQNALIPVMVFIHGGGFLVGASNFALYNPERLVKKGEEIGRPVIVVTVNYRLGAFGWLASSELKQEAEGFHSSSFGNYALWDIDAALEWVQENIKAFGGDPENVTLVGHSAGGIMNSYLNLFESSPNYARPAPNFHKLILLSGNHYTWTPRKLSDSTTQNSFNYLSKKFCSQYFTTDARNHGIQNLLESEHSHIYTPTALLQCMRNVAPEILVGFISTLKNWETLWGPVVDDVIVFSEDIPKLYRNIPTLITSQIDDGTLFSNLLLGKKNPTYNDFYRLAIENFPSSKDNILQEYMWEPLLQFNSINLMTQASYVIRDSLFRCTSLWVAQETVASVNNSKNSDNIFYHEFNQPLNLINLLTKTLTSKRLGSFHGSELIYLFSSIPWLIGRFKEREYGDLLKNRFLSFMYTGSPNSNNSKDIPWMPFQSMENTYYVCKNIWEPLRPYVLPRRTIEEDLEFNIYIK